MRFSTFLVGTDFSAGSDRALESAVALATSTGAAVHLLHVVEDPVLTMPWSEDRAFDLAQLRDALVSDAERRLQAMAAAHPGVSFTVEALVGSPAETIVRAAEERGADVVVVGARGRHSVARVLMGSVAERVLHLARCPVLTVRDVIEEHAARPAAAAATHA